MENENLNQPTNNPVATPVQQQPQSVSSSIVNQKGFLPLIFGGIVLLVVVAGGAYYLGRQSSSVSPKDTNFPIPSGSPITNVVSPTPNNTDEMDKVSDETANWKSYTNTKYNYAVKYPQSWEPNRGPGNLSDSELATQRDIDFYDPTLPGSDPGTGFNIKVNELDANGTSRNCTDLNDCFVKTFSWLTESTSINKTSTTFLGQPALTFTYQRKTNLYTQSWKYLYFIYQGNAYSIQISSNVTRETEVFDIFDKILKTFKFN